MVNADVVLLPVRITRESFDDFMFHVRTEVQRRGADAAAAGGEARRAEEGEGAGGVVAGAGRPTGSPGAPNLYPPSPQSFGSPNQQQQLNMQLYLLMLRLQLLFVKHWKH